jgi:hypothetical protein
MTILRELLPPGGKRNERTAEQIAAAAPPSLDYPATQVGIVGNIKVAYDSALGGQGLTLARQFLNAAIGPYNDMQAFFGITGGTVEVIIAPLSGKNDGSGGAYHYGCEFTSGGVLYLDATFASTTVDPLNLEVALYVAELSESFMGSQGGGWGCGFSNGEGLSRYCAEQETPLGTLNAFVTGPAWATAGFPDWVSQTEQTDQNAISTGCAIVYIYWMRSLGFTSSQIVQAGGTTLLANYQKLTSKATAYQDLLAALQGSTVKSDNPFGGRPAVHQLYYDNAQWVDQDLTGLTKGALAGPASGMSGFALNDGQHVFYVASDQRVHQLYYDNAQWVDQDLTGLTKGALAGPASGMSGFALNDGQHVFYVSG